MANKYGFSSRSGIDVLAGILKHCDSKTNRNILNGLQRDMPQIATALRSKILTFDDLAYADSRGVQRLLKQISLRDLAIALKKTPEAILRNIANNMSPRALCDLKDEIKYIGRTTEKDAERARERIMLHVSRLISDKEMFINRPDADMLY